MRMPSPFPFPGGNGEGLVFAKGKVLRKVPQERLVEELMLEIERL